MHDVNAVAAAIAIAAAFLVTASPILRLPVAVPLAMWSLSDGSDLRIVALGGSLGVVAGCVVLAVASRGGRRRTPSSAAALGERLGRSTQYGSLTFSAGALPVIPARVLFPLLGGLRLPLRFALLGTLVGRLWLFALTTWVVRGVARGLSDTDHQAAQGLAVFAIAWVVLGTLRRVDMEAWQAERRIRLRDDDSRMTGVFGSFGAGPGGGTAGGAGGGIGRGPFAGGPFAAQPPIDDEPEPLGDDEIEGTLLGEEIDGDDDDRPRRR